MKLTYLFILSLFPAFSTNAQQLNSIVNEGAEWHNYYFRFDPQAQDYPYHTIIHSLISGDTLVDSISYKKLWQVRFDSAKNVDGYIVGLLREFDRKVYLRPCLNCQIDTNTEKEYLIYDFGLKINDTLELPGINSDPRFTGSYVVTKDTITIINSDTLKTLGIGKKLTDSTSYTNFHLIDKIGSSNGLLDQYQRFDGWSRNNLMCMKNGNMSLDSSDLRKLPGLDAYIVNWLDCYNIDYSGVPNPNLDQPISWQSQNGQLVLSGLLPNQQVLVHDMSEKQIHSQTAYASNLSISKLQSRAIYTVNVVSVKQVYSFLVVMP
ncbi:MAG: hypothetical protein KDC92_10585 [Bacteroidetes bacterium]|nr:hypothetical protein [Bacteroidota bacterium]